MFDEYAMNAAVWQPLREKLEENVWQGNSSCVRDPNPNFQYSLDLGVKQPAWTKNFSLD
jgi:hypothetical protein